MTYQEAYQSGIRRLEEAGVPDAPYDAWRLLEYVTGMTKSRYFLHSADSADENACERYFAYIQERAARKPLQYIVGMQEFMGMPFCVSPDVLIPRQDTEVLVEQAVEAIRKNTDCKRVLDLCCGSGCIGISVKKLCDCEVTLADLSDGALAVAEKNAEALAAAVTLVKSDLFSALQGVTFDMILSNPPYIRSGEIETLMPEVRQFEPRMALDGEEDGLAFYKAITAEAGAHLSEGGVLMFEIGCEQAADVSRLMRQHGFIDIKVVKDYSGLDRVVLGRLK